MTETTTQRRARLADRWPTALAVLGSVAVVVLVARLDREADYFGPSIAVMAGIYLMAYAVGRPWTAWLAFALLSAVVTALQFLYAHGVVAIDAPVTMTFVLVLLWLWAVLRNRSGGGRTMFVQTAGMLGFGALTLICAAVEPRWAVQLAGAGILAHAAWDAYHFTADKVVNRAWSEFCGVLDVLTGVALIVAAMV
jgi:hypothetical protein